MGNRTCFFLVVLLLIVSCTKETRKISAIGLFDISKDDRSIIFSWSQNDRMSIFQIDTNGVLVKEIVPASTDSNYYNPKYNSDGSKIIFVGCQRGSVGNCSLYISNSDGTMRKQLLDVKGIITEAMFSNCENKIYYIYAKEFGSASPLGREQPHLANIYSLNIEDGKVEQVTNLDAYSMFRVSEYKCDKLLMYIPYPSSMGMVTVSKETGNAKKVQPTNNPRNDSTLYYIPNYSHQFNVLAFTAPYELYIMNMQDKQAKLVIRADNMINDFRFFTTKRRIVYTNESDNCFYFIDFLGGKKRTLKVDLNTEG